MGKPYKSEKKAYKKMKRKLVLPWKILAIFCAVLTLIMSVLTVALNMFDNTVAAMVGGSFWELENEDPNAQYFVSDFATEDEMTAYGLDLCRQVEAEGAALLTNNGALPLFPAYFIPDVLKKAFMLLMALVLCPHRKEKGIGVLQVVSRKKI